MKENALGIIENERPEGSTAGFVFLKTDGTVCLSFNGDALFVPASVMKIVTSVSALGILGPDFVYETSVCLPERNSLRNGAIDGDLYLKGTGDPTLSEEKLEFLAWRLKGSGIERINGDLVIDDSVFSSERYGIGWMWDDREDNPLVGAVSFGGKEDDPAFCDPDSVPLAVGAVLRRELERIGIRVSGKVKRGKNGAGSVGICSVSSEPLSEMVRIMNKKSDNFIAEQLFRTIGHRVFGTGTSENSARAESDFLADLTGRRDGFRIVDGSGLSRYNLLSPSFVSALLLGAWKADGDLGSLFRSFPVSGKDGTLSGRLGDLEVRAKTGTMIGISGLSGVLRTKSGTDLIFSAFVNNYLSDADSARKYLDSVVSFAAGNF